ncbi:DNA polymerase epsilon catalytic subunit A [Manis javanica]|nr:DNA polymerase epsilon catalytic subunit A [Manis javanica]
MLASLPAAAAVLSAAVRSGAGPVAQLMRAGGLYCVFQPLADLRSGSIYAHEALIRGPRGMPLHTPDALLKGAAAEGILREFELLAVCVALQDWGRQSAPGRLFINLSAQALVQAVGVCGPGMVGDTVRIFGVQARSLVVEITEHDHVTDMPPSAPP